MARAAAAVQHDGEPVVSVIMPVYNAADSLPAAIESVLGQTLSSLEVLIVDDASEDDTLQVAERFAARDPRVRVLRQATNRGPAAARNLALDVARGVWVAPVDADDEIRPDRLRLLAETGDREQADLIADGILFQGVRTPGTPAELVTWRANGHGVECLSAKDFILSDIPAGGRCSLGYLKPLMRRRFLDTCNLRYAEDLRFAEDFHLYARALFCDARFLLYPESHYIYRQTPASVSRTESKLPRMASHAVASNRRLKARLPERLAADVAAVLAEREQRWLLVSWFERMKRAATDGQLQQLVRILFDRPTSVGDMLRFAGDRARMKRRAPGNGLDAPADR